LPDNNRGRGVVGSNKSSASLDFYYFRLFPLSIICIKHTRKNL